MPILLVEKGIDKGKIFLIKKESVIIGREKSLSFRLKDNAISRKHFKIIYKNKRYFIQDIGSLNGTQLNKIFIEPQKEIPLEYGDTITIGETVLRWYKNDPRKERDPLLDTIFDNKYVIASKLGQGGMGIVYKARQLTLDRDVALKILSPKYEEDEKFIKRFLEEAKSAAKLNHPNIIQVYDVGEYNKYYYFTMEYAPGGSLQSIITGGKKIEWTRAIDYMLHTAKGLEFAERKKIVHRDIKPDNLMIGEDYIIKIGDLGLAMQSGKIGEESRVYGTPHYISPEQIRQEKIDHRADIYSFGASFYRILSGKTPFSANNLTALLRKHLKEKPTPLHQLDPSIPRSLSNIISKMLEKKPEDRFQSNSEIIEEIFKIKERKGDKETRVFIKRGKKEKKFQKREVSDNLLVEVIQSILFFFILVFILKLVLFKNTNNFKGNSTKEYKLLLRKLRKDPNNLNLFLKFKEYFYKYPDTTKGKKCLKRAFLIIKKFINKINNKKIDKNTKELIKYYYYELKWIKNFFNNKRIKKEIENLCANINIILSTKSEEKTSNNIQFPMSQEEKELEKRLKELERLEKKFKAFPERREENKKQENNKNNNYNLYKNKLKEIQTQINDLKKDLNLFNILKKIEKIKNLIINQKDYINNDNKLSFPLKEKLLNKIKNLKNNIKTILNTKLEEFIKRIEKMDNLDEIEEIIKIFNFNKDIIIHILSKKKYNYCKKVLNKQKKEIIKNEKYKIEIEIYKKLLKYNFNNIFNYIQNLKNKRNYKFLVYLKKDIKKLQDLFYLIKKKLKKNPLYIRKLENITKMQSLAINNIFLVDINKDDKNNLLLICKITIKNISTSIIQKLPLYKFSPHWIFFNIIKPLFDNKPKYYSKLALYCYYFRLYIYAKKYLKGRKNKKMRIKFKNIEKIAKQKYLKIVNLYKELEKNRKNYKNKKFIEKFKILKKELKEFKKYYFYTYYYKKISK